MQDFKFTAVSGGDWAELMVGKVEGTSTPLADIDTGEIQVQVQDKNGSVMLNLTTEDSSITRPESGQFQWIVATANMGSFCPGDTYFVGCRHVTDAGATTILWTGSLSYIVSGYKWR